MSRAIFSPVQEYEEAVLDLSQSYVEMETGNWMEDSKQEWARNDDV